MEMPHAQLGKLVRVFRRSMNKVGNAQQLNLAPDDIGLLCGQTFRCCLVIRRRVLGDGCNNPLERMRINVQPVVRP